VLPGGMRIEGRGAGPAFSGAEVDSFGDHRIAMSFAVASLRAAQPISIRDVANVSTSFPGFVALARSAGLDISESDG
jgi:3-phosphoshikimate 1-carboxyvinyltransferase